jgi:hypothetical protein
MPLSDWRDGYEHLDAQDWPAIHDRGYLQSNIAGGANTMKITASVGRPNIELEPMSEYVKFIEKNDCSPV